MTGPVHGAVTVHKAFWEGNQVPTFQGRTCSQGYLTPISIFSWPQDSCSTKSATNQKDFKLSAVTLWQLPDFSSPRSTTVPNNCLSLWCSELFKELSQLPVYLTVLQFGWVGEGGIIFTWRISKMKLLLCLANSYTQHRSRQSGSRSQGFWNAGSRSRLLHWPIWYKQTL